MEHMSIISMPHPYGLANWFVSKDKEKFSLSNITIPLIRRLSIWLVDKDNTSYAGGPISKLKSLSGRVALLLGSSLLLLAEAVTRVVIGYAAFIGGSIGLNQGRRIKDFGLDQIQKGSYALLMSVICAKSIKSPGELVGYLSKLRSYRVIQQDEVIRKKLEKELYYAQKEKKIENGLDEFENDLDEIENDRKMFKYHSDMPEKFEKTTLSRGIFVGNSENGEIDNYPYGVCCAKGRREYLEDEYLIASFEWNVGQTSYPVQLFGIFDGHGGSIAAIHVKRSLQGSLIGALNQFCSNELTDTNVWNALKITFAKLNESYNEYSSGTTATVAMILEGNLWTANVGDSRAILDVDGGIQLTEDAKPEGLRYQKGIEKRGGWIEEPRDRRDVYRVNGDLAVARALGDLSVPGINPRPKITVYPLSKILPESHLILACDGIYDVASTKQVASLVIEHKESSAFELAKSIVYSAIKAESSDNCSALVVKFLGL